MMVPPRTEAQAAFWGNPHFVQTHHAPPPGPLIGPPPQIETQAQTRSGAGFNGDPSTHRCRGDDAVGSGDHFVHLRWGVGG